MNALPHTTQQPYDHMAVKDYYLGLLAGRYGLLLTYEQLKRLRRLTPGQLLLVSAMFARAGHEAAREKRR